MLHVFLMSEPGHFKTWHSKPQFNLGKHFCLSVVEAMSAGKMHVRFLSAKRHAHPNRYSSCLFWRKNPSISQCCEELFDNSLTCTTTTWMDTWSGSLIGARKYCDNATRRWSIATRLLAWTAEIDIKNTSYKMQRYWSMHLYSSECRDCGFSSSSHLDPGALLRKLSFIFLLLKKSCECNPVSNICQHQSISFCNMSGCHRLVQMEI